MTQEPVYSTPIEPASDSGTRPLSGCWQLILVWLGLNVLFALFAVGAGVLALSGGRPASSWGLIISGTLFGVILLVVANSVLKRKKWGRIAVVVLMGLNILGAAIQVLSGASATVSIAALPSIYGVYWILTHPETY